MNSNLFNSCATLTVVNDCHAVYGSLRGQTIRESPQNESSQKITYIRGYKTRKNGSHSFATFFYNQQQVVASAVPRKNKVKKLCHWKRWFMEYWKVMRMKV